MSSDDDYSDDDAHPMQISSESIKDHLYIIHKGKPPATSSSFGIQSKKAKWPEDLWKSGDQVYDLLDKQKCLPPPTDPSDTILRFESHFESGNLSQAFHLSGNVYHLILEYDHNTSGSCQWFYFRLTNARKDAKYTFYISGFHKKKSLYSSGGKVFWYSEKQATIKGISWSRAGYNYAYAVTQGSKKHKRATLQFQIKFPYDGDQNYLCYALPYTYSDLLHSIYQWKEKDARGILTSEILCKTLGGRECPLLTLTSPDSQVEQKKYLFFTGRIHPGESNGSFLVKGLIDFLLSNSTEAKFLLDRYIIKVVPMLNIDGVIEGFYRISLSGNDLNRMWTSPDVVLHPVIYQTKQLMTRLSKERPVDVYIDFHGHSRLHGTFAYGCPNQDSAELRDTEKFFPRILSFLSDTFSWNHCVFSMPKDRKAAGRIVARTEMDIVQSFTVESSFGGVTSGPRAGVLYDENLWLELGQKCGEAVFHLLSGSESPLMGYIAQELSFLTPATQSIEFNSNSCSIPYKFAEDIDDETSSAPPIGRRGFKMFRLGQPKEFLACNASDISASARPCSAPKWEKIEYVLN